MRIVALSAIAAALVTGCARNEPPPVAAAEAPAPAVDPNSPLAAPMYMQMAASGDQFEIQSSQLAMQRSSNQAIRSFAQMLITDHTRMSSEMMAAAQAAGLTPPPASLLPEHSQMLQQLQATPAGSFDMAYRDMQVTAHQQALQLHQNYASGGDNPALRTVATNAVQAIQMHLSTAQSLSVAAQAPTPTYQEPAKPGQRG